MSSFVDSVNSLFNEIETWIASTKLKGSRHEIEISEEASGKYKVVKLILVDEGGKKVAELTPVGTFIIGGSGRIDLNGSIDKAIIVSLEVGDPSMATSVTVGGQTETGTNSFYQGIDKQGWYWIEDKRRGKANFFTKELFIELLREVSDYELA